MAMVQKIIVNNNKMLLQQIGTTPYWHAAYGKQNKVVMHAASGYINVTKFCKEFNKLFKSWSRLKWAKDLVKEITAVTLVDGQPINPAHMLILIKGGSGDSVKDVCGTYAHPILFPIIASWASSFFAGGVATLANARSGLTSVVTRAALDSLLLDNDVPKEDVVVGDNGEEANEEKAKKIKESQQVIIYKRNVAKLSYQVFEGSSKSVRSSIKRFIKSPAGTIVKTD